MTYEEILQKMFTSLPMYQRQGAAAYKADLSNTWALAELTGHPQNSFKSIHIAGTNGKGSTAHMLTSIFMEAGYKVGLYTSPHLVDFRERIKINGQMIPMQNVVDFYSTYSSKWTEIQPSFFEMTVLMAFDYFRTEKVDIAIIETGMGGRLDSTNIVTPEVSVITNIGLDHTQFLGNTIPLIAGEKAGIVKEEIPVVCGEMLPEALEVIQSVATRKNAPNTSSTQLQEYESDLKGQFQKQNIQTVLKTIAVIRSQGKYFIQEPHIKAGLAYVKSNTGLRGRYDSIDHSPKIIADGAHNTDGIKLLLNELNNENYNQLRIVWSMVSDKDVQKVFNLLPNEAIYYFCQSSVPRAMKIEDLVEYAQSFNLKYTAHATVQKALLSAKNDSSDSDLILVTGSFFTVADALAE
ncbi:MAG: folylpolyglutamate synthase/dihydrofolate synthase family protein [Flavobacteriales bacterium]